MKDFDLNNKLPGDKADKVKKPKRIAMMLNPKMVDIAEWALEVVKQDRMISRKIIRVIQLAIRRKGVSHPFLNL